MTQHALDNAAAFAAARLRAEEAADCIAAMRLQEESDAYRRADYLASLPASTHEGGGDDQQDDEGNPPGRPQSQGFSARPVDAECRRKMSDWCLKVVDYCGFDRETVSVAMTYLDRFLSSSSTNRRAHSVLTSRREYQLASMTSLYLAVKIHEPLLTMDAEHVSGLSRGSYSASEVTAMERDILDGLNWRTSDPTPLGFLSRFVALLPPSASSSQSVTDDENDSAGAATTAESVMLEMGRTQTELAVAEYSFVPRNASTVAVAALLNAVEVAGDFLLSPSEAHTFLGNVARATGVDLWGDEVDAVRSKLRVLLARSNGEEGGEASCAASACTASTAEETEPEMDSDAETVCSDSEETAMLEDDEEEEEPEPIEASVVSISEYAAEPQSSGQAISCSTTQEETGIARRLFGFGRSSLAAACSLASRINAQGGSSEMLSLL